MAFRLTMSTFLADQTGNGYADVVGRATAALTDAFSVLNQRACQGRLVDAEAHHDLPAIAGAERAIGRLPSVTALLRTESSAFVRRFKSAVGVAVRLTMEGIAWRKTGRTTPVGPNRFVRTGERYVPANGQAPEEFQLPGRYDEWPDLVHVEPRPDFRLAATFSNGVSGTLDMSALVKQGVFRQISDPISFASVRLEGGVPVWLTGAIDLAPEFVHDWMEPDPQQH